ncbi:MAG: hypothetical protein J0H34_01365 [Rhizobiales bacterium]|nr:hypothetical protein [Hyphomicrobiales bacterium]
MFEFESGKDRFDVSSYGYASTAEVFARGVNDGAGNSYFAFDDGLDFLCVVGLELDDLGTGDFIV